MPLQYIDARDLAQWMIVCEALPGSPVREVSIQQRRAMASFESSTDGVSGEGFDTRPHP